VVAVTGRPVRWLAQVYQYLAAPIPAVCANGAVIYDPIEQTLVEHAVEPATLAEVMRRLRAADPTLTFAVEVDGGQMMRREADYPIQAEGELEDVRTVATEQLWAEPATKLLARAPYGTRDPDELADSVAAVVGDLVATTHSSRSGLVEMSAAGVSKASGLAEFAAARGIAAADVLAFGDMPNDVPMLVWAGFSVAVAGAHPAARAVADAITGGNDDDGVAAFLEGLLDDKVRAVNCGEADQRR
jgi:HAD superfamily hydrolase (TIGR01484 family)